MKHILRKEFFREIRKSRNRYLSLLFIVALGVAFFSGVRSAEPDMELSADVLFDDTNFLDIRVLSTLGLTEDDCQAIAAVDGVAQTEGVHTLEALAATTEKEFVLQVNSLTTQISTPRITEGRLPEQADECLLDTVLQSYYSIGDTITLYGEKDTDLSDSLSCLNFTVTGFAENPSYLSLTRGTASIGNGSCSGLLYLMPEVFTADYYTSIYVSVDGAKNLVSYSNAYESSVDSVVSAIEDIADARCEIRYAGIYNDATDAIQKGRDKLNDAKEEADTELADARKELTDGESELADAKATLEEKEQELADGKKELADGEKQLQDGKSQLANGWDQYYSGLDELEANAQQLADARAELESQEALFLEQKQTYEEGKAQLDAGFAALADADAQLTAGENELEAAATNLPVLRQTLADQLNLLESSGMADAAQIEELKAQLAQIDASIDALDAQREELVANRQALEAQRQALTEKQAELNAAGEQIAAAETQLSTAKTQLSEGEAQLEAGRKTLAESYNTLAANQAKLDASESELSDARDQIADAESQIADAKDEIADAENDLADGWKEYEDGKQEADEKIADAEKELADAEADLNDLKYPDWYVLDRDTIQSYVEYGMDAERIGNLGKVFPAIFFLVAALVSLTTMTRMVEEERTQIGTLKALGYSKGAIAAKYMAYALSATILGSILGVLVGSRVLPWVIISAYQMMYNGLTATCTPIQPVLALMSALIAICCTGIATWAACYKEFLAEPAELMRPAAPAQGKRILLERITFLWKHLSFTSKSTLRNLFRYKKRFFMTVFGIGGCMALLMVGFGLRDSIAKIVDTQYTTVNTYQFYLSLDSEEPEEPLTEVLSASAPVQEFMTDYKVTKTMKNGAASEDAYLFVPEDPSLFPDFIHLRSRTRNSETYSLSDDGVILTEKLADMLNLKVGDTFTIAEDDTSGQKVTVLAIAENYLHHYVYMTPALYESLYGHAPEYNEVLLIADEMSADEENAFAVSLLDLDAVTSVNYVRDLQETVDNMMRSLDFVIWVLIISAGLLAFVVLYNLNNINITERRRELATLKVLGFYDGEVAGYVYRENILLTIFGIASGIVLGLWLHHYVIQTVEVDMLMFGQKVRFLSYVYSSLFTILFSVIVNVSMYFKLKKIDMIESLKSVE